VEDIQLLLAIATFTSWYGRGTGTSFSGGSGVCMFDGMMRCVWFKIVFANRASQEVVSWGTDSAVVVHSLLRSSAASQVNQRPCETGIAT